MSEPRERPILFSGAMVKAILAGQKTQTRRVVKGASGAFWDHAGWAPSVEGGRIVWRSLGYAMAMPKRCPQGVPGDRLWVRESWAGADGMYQEHDLDPPGVIAYYADQSAIQFNACPRRQIPAWDLVSWNWRSLKKRPAIHMPRWASRLTVEVTDVRVERLQAISEQDALAEGVQATAHGTFEVDNAEFAQARTAFAYLWDGTNERAPWSSNPWVWVVAFKRLGGGDG